jgi:hypothetical protein
MAVILLVCLLLVVLGLAAMAEEDSEQPTPPDKPNWATWEEWNQIQADAMLAELIDKHKNRSWARYISAHYTLVFESGYRKGTFVHTDSYSTTVTNVLCTAP